MDNIFLKPLSEDVVDRIFDCGESQINEQILHSYYRHLLNQISVYEILIANSVVGYVAVSVVGVSLDLADGDIVDYCDGDSSFGALKINFIGVRRRLQGNGIGSTVIQMIIQKARSNALELPIRFLVLDAINSKVDWYAKRGFKSLNTNENDTSFTKGMYLDMMDEQHKAAIEKYCDEQIG